MFLSRGLKIFLVVGLALAALIIFKFPKLSQKITTQLIPSSQPKQLVLQDIAKMLQASPSAETDKKIFEAIEKLGKEGNKITLNDCNPDPQILKLNSEQLTIVNASTKVVKVSGIPTLKQSLSAGENISVKIDPALYSYSCESVATSSATPQVRGLIYLTQTKPTFGMETIKQQAKETNILSLSSCQSDQPAIKIKKGSNLTFKNIGKERERIYLSDIWDFNLEIGSENIQPVNLKEGRYTVSCQSKTSDFIPAATIFVF